MPPSVRNLLYLLIDKHCLTTLSNAFVALLPERGGIASLGRRYGRSVGWILQPVSGTAQSPKRENSASFRGSAVTTSNSPMQLALNRLQRTLDTRS